MEDYCEKHEALKKNKDIDYLNLLDSVDRSKKRNTNSDNYNSRDKDVFRGDNRRDETDRGDDRRSKNDSNMHESRFSRKEERETNSSSMQQSRRNNTNNNDNRNGDNDDDRFGNRRGGNDSYENRDR